MFEPLNFFKNHLKYFKFAFFSLRFDFYFKHIKILPSTPF